VLKVLIPEGFKEKLSFVQIIHHPKSHLLALAAHHQTILLHHETDNLLMRILARMVNIRLLASLQEQNNKIRFNHGSL
jgi:hypothetical protein